MKLLFDFFPIVLFFITFKFFGIYVATGVMMAGSFLQVGIHWLKHRKFEPLHLITLVIVLVLGTITLLLHNELFIKWKPSVIYWVFALSFLLSQYIGKQSLVQRMLDKQIDLPDFVWRRLNISWVVFFVVMGAVNAYVIYHFTTNGWVNFKLFGALGMTLLFLVLQAVYMARHLKKDNVEGVVSK